MQPYSSIDVTAAWKKLRFIPKETVAAITILYRNTKVKVRSPDGDTEYFDIVAGVLQGDTLAPYLFIICLDYVLRTSIDKIKENGFELTKKRRRRYPAKTITDADYADDIAILANTPDQAETLLHSLERAAASIGLYVNAHKTEYMCYNQTGGISTLEGTPLKLVDKFTYLRSSVESTEKDIETRLSKAWTAINWLSIIWKSDLYIYIYIYILVIGPKREKSKYFIMNRSTKKFALLKNYSFHSYIRVCLQLVAFVREQIRYKAIVD